jgi:hypothetical protein
LFKIQKNFLKIIEIRDYPPPDGWILPELPESSNPSSTVSTIELIPASCPSIFYLYPKMNFLSTGVFYLEPFGLDS